MKIHLLGKMFGGIPLSGLSGFVAWSRVCKSINLQAHIDISMSRGMDTKVRSVTIFVW